MADHRPPAQTLTEVIGRLLDDSPCYVGFSGGADSSLVLSAATAACRAVGHSDPIPVTYRYSAPDADESDFQESEVRRLALREWVKFDLGVDADLLSPTTCTELVAAGPMWPPAPLSRANVLRGLHGGLWLTGEGGDEVLGPRRVSYADRAIRAWAHKPLRPPIALLRRGATELAPRLFRVRAAEFALARDYRCEWLDVELRRRYIREAATLEAIEPLRPSRWFEHYLARPAVTVGHAAVRAFKARFGLRWEAPLVDREFLGSLAGSLSWHEYRGRRHLLRQYFSDLLPADIIDRRSKATFNSALFGPYTRAFAAGWDGGGTPVGVDGAWLKDHWQSPQVSAGTAPLLHHVWLANHGVQRAEDDTRCR